tara:strand:+ start:1203 stop:1955 length:753 start_codon:yes stop_codon:yes gene_type:complete
MTDYLGTEGDNIIKKLNLVDRALPLTIQAFRDKRAKDRGYKMSLNGQKENCCESPDILNTGSVLVCKSCGVSSEHFLVSEWVRPTTPYKRVTHFKDWLIKSQAKHTLEIDPDIIRGISDTIPVAKLSYYSIRNYLKKRGLFKYYEDIALILQTLTGKVHFLLTSTEEQFLINKFILINKVYNTVKQKNRKSIISYSFIIRSLIRLFFTKKRQSELNLDFFVLPQPEKVLEYSQVFKKISNYYSWAVLKAN